MDLHPVVDEAKELSVAALIAKVQLLLVTSK